MRPVFLPFKAVCQRQIPPFERLLNNPQIKDLRMMDDFNAAKESEHLLTLWERSSQLRRYRLTQFISAGSCGMVFQAAIDNSPLQQAIKIVRSRSLCTPHAMPSLAYPMTSDLRVLKSMNHPGMVRLLDAIECNHSIIAISTSFVDRSVSLDKYVWHWLTTLPPVKESPNVFFDHWRCLESICGSLTERFLELAEALVALHSLGICHFDIKPSNILIDSAGTHATLTDFDSCVYLLHRRATPDFPVCFTSTYAHPELMSAAGRHSQNWGGGNGLKARAVIRNGCKMDKYDLFALGRTIQETLGILEWHFGEECFSSSAFNYLHLMACLLLDGQNSPAADDSRIVQRNGRRFMDDIACDYEIEAFQRNKITSAHDLLERLVRVNQPDRCRYKTPQIDAWADGISKKGITPPIPFRKKPGQLDFHGTGYIGSEL